MVLGIQWLATLGKILLDFQDLTMDFKYNKRRMMLRGTKNSFVNWMQGKYVGSGAQLKQAELSSMMLCVYPKELWKVEGVSEVNPEVKEVLA